MTDAGLVDFIRCYHPENRPQRSETWSEENPDGRWRKFPVQEILDRDKASLGIFWIRDKSLADLDSLPAPDVLALDIIKSLSANSPHTSCLHIFRHIAPKFLDRRQPACEILTPSGGKSDDAICARPIYG